MTTKNQNRTILLWLFSVAFALSGFSALAYQVTWQRVLTQVIGSDAISMLLIVVTFMVWLGVAAELARRFLPRLGLKVGLFYALLEIIIGLFGLISIPTLRIANAWLAGTGSDTIAADITLNMLLLAIPIIGMGMTTPLIIEIAKSRLSALGHTVGRFYGLNIFGASLGAVCTGLVLIESFGLSGVTTLAASINLLIGIIIFSAVNRRQDTHIESTDFPLATSPKSYSHYNFKKSITIYKLAAVLFGFGTLALQVVYFRVLSNYFTLSVIVFPLVLSAYLFLMSMGQVLGGRLADRFADKLEAVAISLFIAGSMLFFASLNFPPSTAAKWGALAFTSFNGQMVSNTFPQLIGDPAPETVFIYSLLFMISVLFWSALFPVMLRLMTRDIHESGSQFASLYALYTLGNILGVFFTGLYLFEWFGTGGTASATILITGIGAFLIALRKISRIVLISASVVTLFSAALIPQDYYKTFSVGRYQITDVYEGRAGVATVVPTGRFYSIIDFNRTASASALIENPRPKDQYQAWRWNHTEIFALDPKFRPRSVLIIGIGHAYLIDALLDLPFIEKITVVDISKEIVDAVREHTQTSTKRVFTDPRVEIQIADGRRFVQKALAQGVRYDLIQTKITEPWHAGSGNLFTVEFFEMQKQLLNTGGYLSVRPKLGHVVNGLSVFNNAVWPGYYHLFFKNGQFHTPKEAKITADIEQAWHKELPGLNEATSQRDNKLNLIVFPEYEIGKDVLANTDDLPSYEYNWLAQQLGKWISPRISLWYMSLPMQEIPVVIHSEQNKHTK